MANRPVFVPIFCDHANVSEVSVDFKWYPGMAASQKQKSVDDLHNAAIQSLGLSRVLEVSTKSKESLGRALSAFNLKSNRGEGLRKSVEVVYQSSKVFERGGPFSDILSMDSYSAKTDERLKNCGALVHFLCNGDIWPLRPPTAFYDWLYISALVENPVLATAVTAWDAFTDIEFNPKRSLNCQARSAALFCSLIRRGELELALKSPEDFRELVSVVSENGGQQTQLF